MFCVLLVMQPARTVVMCCTPPIQHCETKRSIAPGRKAPMLDITWFMTNKFPVQVTLNLQVFNSFSTFVLIFF